MLRVLHITTDYLPGTGGMERFVHDLAAHTAGPIEPRILCFNRIAGQTAKLPANDTIDNVPIHRVGFLNLKYYKPTILPLSLLRQADILHLHGLGAHLDFTAAASPCHRRPIVLSTHGGIFHTPTLGLLKQAYFAWVRTLILPAVDRIIACGEADARLFAAHGVPNLPAINNGVTLPPPSSDASHQPNRLLFAGRLAPNKRIDLLLEAIARLRRSIPQVTLHIAGPDRNDLLATLQQRTAQLNLTNHVHFLGKISDTDLATEYAAADLFLSASEHEGFGISAVEAMARGCIPALSNIPAFAALIAPDQPNPPGMLIDFPNPDQAAHQLQSLLETDRASLREAARRRAATFSWDRITPQWLTLYQHLVESQRPNPL